MISELDLTRLDGVAHLPQHRRLIAVVTDLWRDPAIVAIWLGGSLARGEGDRWSDIDLRVAVRPGTHPLDALPPSASRLAAEVLGTHHIRFGAATALFHMLLSDGEIYDLLIQTTDHPPTGEARLVLGCRDAALGELLASGQDPPVRILPAEGPMIHQLIVDFWISQQKQQRVLARGLPVMAWEGEHRMRLDLIRLWYVLETGSDPGPLGRTTIHTLTPVVRAVQERNGTELLRRIGRPLRDVPEIVAGAAETASEVARVGRLLAGRLGFAYPEALEETVRRSWRAFHEAQGT
jgi:hypothetical protein